MTDKEKTIRELKEVLDGLDITNKYRLNLIRAIEYLQEEPVSEEFNAMCLDENGNPTLAKETDFTRGFVKGAQWQKRKDSASVSEELEEACEQLAENARKHKAETSSPFFSQTDYRQGVVDGAKWKIAKLMKDATPVTVHIDAGGYPYIPQLELYDYDKDVPLAKEGDKYKVILIKEE